MKVFWQVFFRKCKFSCRFFEKICKLFCKFFHFPFSSKTSFLRQRRKFSRFPEWKHCFFWQISTLFRAHPYLERVRLNKHGQQNQPKLIADGVQIPVETKRIKILSLHPTVIKEFNGKDIDTAFLNLFTAYHSLEEPRCCGTHEKALYKRMVLF